MLPGKAASQSGHAFLDSFLQAHPDIQRAYLADGHGTKVVLVAEDEAALFGAQAAARAAGLPCALVEDSGHIMPPHFDGSLVTTGLGIGPATRDQVRRITERFGCMR
jgi:peptidyl-tRNA hydrolase, PTH2 family